MFSLDSYKFNRFEKKLSAPEDTLVFLGYTDIIADPVVLKNNVCTTITEHGGAIRGDRLHRMERCAQLQQVKCVVKRNGFIVYLVNFDTKYIAITCPGSAFFLLCGFCSVIVNKFDPIRPIGI